MANVSSVWASPVDVCNGCGGNFNGTMFDAKTPQGWANLCCPCFSEMGLTLGTGKGQRYDLTELHDGKYWLKTGG